jgi:branched-chain amino acid transport system permease protein
MNLFLIQLANGLATGSIYALVAVGYSMVYGVLGLINFANNAFMVGAAYLLILFLKEFSLPMFPAVVLSIILCGVLAMLMDRFSLNIIRHKGNSDIAALICTVGYSTVIINLLMVAFGSQSNPVPNLFKFRTFMVGSVLVDPLQIVIFCMSFVMMVILSLITYCTRFGDAMRAISQNTRAAYLMGIKVDRIIMGTFFIGTVCTALSGIMIGTYYGAIDTGMSFAIGIKTFAAAVLGGIGVLHGSMIGGLAIGVIETFVAGYISAGYRDAIAFVVLILVLILKPTGIFGKQTINKV